MRRRVVLETLGCRANQADSAYLAGALQQKGYEVVNTIEGADIYLLNTCTVTGKADQEARQLTRRAKRRQPKIQVIVTGCYAQTQPEAVAALPSVDSVIGNTEKGELPALLGESLPAVRVSPITPQRQVPSFGLATYSKNTRASVKIQDGCNRYCTFCIIPKARGRSRSVPIRDVLHELHNLRAAGFEEAILTGIHIGTFGVDRGESLEQLLQLIDLEKPLSRVRLSSIDPEEVSDRMIETIATSDVLCPHFHIPLQSGEDTVLARMKRRYRADDFRRLVEKIETLLPEAGIGTDVIVGFPGESPERFRQTEQLLNDLPLSYFHVFPYSKRKGTPAAQLGSQIPQAIKKERGARLRALSDTKKQNFYRRFVGTTQEVVVEEKRDLREGFLKGVTRNYLPVFFKGPNRLYQKRVAVKIERLNGLRLYGMVL